MASLTEFRRVASDLSNWGRWGDTDELGTLNFITADTVRHAASLVRHGKVFPLGVDFGSSGPQGAFGFRHNPIHVMTVDGGDANTLGRYGPGWTQNPTAEQMGNYLVDNPFRFNDDMVIMPLQAATQWDALSHVYYDDLLYNGFPAGSVTSLGAFHCGIDKVDVKGITSRGVLLDLVRHRGAEVFLEHGNPITPEELDDVVRAQGVTVGRGDIVLIRTGWWARFLMTGNKTERYSGLDWRCAQWLHDHEVAAVASDNLQVEDPVSGVEGLFLPFHLLCLRDMGLMLGEYWDLTALAADCATDGVYEFQLIAPPLRFIGAVGSPVNPVAIK
ncbi:cyclase [Mycobacterium kansasii]|uniref:cyclase family protein n=1 Tax=Mycobacterium kansasii TaxID=1768 RepID=UPI000CDD8282|nr:cyclase family protein [Mycobacterium kansasii]POX89066.1 cyclase [Mycobacterium kansasii]POY02334.1 cyclase [Mycobacterium kansasii]POY06866.1 cyclase [Mycobacterium kansasii]POY20495.1 cyclase [Mycobacterium kansasii]POY27363.1 cyclase [Mycobacterium kansasii]